MAVSNLKRLTYPGLADEYGVTLCRSCDAHAWSHWNGYSNPSRGVIHWSRARMTRLGLQTFLGLVADIIYSLNRMGSTTRNVYLRSRWTYEEAQKHGVYLRMPLIRQSLYICASAPFAIATEDPALAEEIRAWAWNRRKK
jgi:hypothetical protein